MSELATVVLVFLPIEVDTDGVLALRAPRPGSRPGNASTVHSLVEVNLVGGKLMKVQLGSWICPTYPTTSKPTVPAKVCNRSTAIVVGIRVVEVVSCALGEPKKTGQLDLETLLRVSCDTSGAALCLDNDVKYDRTTRLLAEMFAIANHVPLAVGIG